MAQNLPTIPRRTAVGAAFSATALMALHSTAANAATLRGSIGALYWSSSLMRSELGSPLTDEIAYGDGGCYQGFSGGRAYWHPATGTSWVRHGGIYTFYQNSGGATGGLGYPVSNVYANSRGVNGWTLETRNPVNGARYSIEWDNRFGAIPVYLNGAIGARWARDKQFFGAPSDAERGLTSTSVYQHFTNGIISWTGESGTRYYTGAYGVYQGMLRRTDITLTTNDALVIGDSQVFENSWVGQGFRQAGWNTVFYRNGGLGFYANRFNEAPSYWDGVVNNAWALPIGDPGVIYIGGSGNDLWTGRTNSEIVGRLRETVLKLRSLYPSAPIVVSEVLSRRIAEQANRHELSEAIRRAASELGIGCAPTRFWVSDYGVSAHLEDSVHLNQTGHNLLAPYLASWLRNAGFAPRRGYQVTGGIGAYYRRTGGQPRYGNPTGNEYASGAGVVQNFDKGWTIYWTPDYGTYSIRSGSGIGNKYRSLGSETGALGYPASEEYPLDYGACQEFINPGTGARTWALWAPNTGTFTVNRRGGIYYKWASSGYTGNLGFPVTDEIARDGGAIQYFRNSSGQETGVYWSPATGAKTLNSRGGIYYRYVSDGYTAKYGFPTTDEHVAADGRVKVFFSKGYVISWSAGEGVRVSRA